MQLPTPRFFAIRRPWLFLLVPVLLSTAFVAFAAVPTAQDAPPPPNCIENVFGGELQCTAEDVKVSQVYLVEGPAECRLGDLIRVKLQAELVATAQDRYDIGLFVAQDGGDARTGLCTRDYLAPPLAARDLYDPGAMFTQPAAGDPPAYTGGGPFLTSEDEPDSCGDIEQAVPTFRDVGELPSDAGAGPVWVEIKCQDNVNVAGDPVPDQIADVSTCISWDNQANATPACTSVTDTKPGTPSKCRCDTIQIAGLTVPPVDIQPRLKLVKVMNIKYGGKATAADFQASVSDGVTSTEVEWDTFVGFKAGTYDANETGLAGYTASDWSGDCASDGAITLLPGDEKTCYITNSDTNPDNPPPPDEDGPKTVCVDGYVINHQELPVDGTRVEMGYELFPLIVTATNEDGETFTAAVDEDGYFKFEALDAAKSYKFSLDLPPGWQGIVPATILTDGTDDPVTGFTHFDESETCYKIVFKIKRLVTIPVLKWEEKLDGTLVRGEDWLITATPVGDPFAEVVTATVTSGFTLITLTPGTWTVAETVKAGWIPLVPPTVTRVVDQYDYATPPVPRYPIVFKNREPVCHPKITVTKIGYGTMANGELGALGTLAGWTFTVSRADMTAPSITRATGGDGRAVFDDLLPGIYKVTETVQPGWDVRGDNPVTVVLVACEEAEVTFENEELIGDLSISGKKLFQAWEEPYKGTLVGLAGWKITATLVGTEDLDIPVQLSTTTNALGEYEFSMDVLGAAGMAFGGASIEVCEEDRDHWIAITPECVTVKFPFPVPPEYEGEVVNFTNIQDPPAGGT